MDKQLLKNSIRLLIGGYLYDTNIADDEDEFEKLLNVPEILKEMSEEYNKEIKNFEEEMSKSIKN